MFGRIVKFVLSRRYLLNESRKMDLRYHYFTQFSMQQKREELSYQKSLPVFYIYCFYIPNFSFCILISVPTK